MNLSFLIPALNEAHNIGKCIESIRASVPAGLSYEIIVGDHGSRDGTPDIARKLGATVLPHPRSTVGAMRNSIAALATGEVFVFLDADVTLTDDWRTHIESVVGELRGNPARITGSMCVPPATGSYFLNYWFSRIRTKESTYLGTGHMLTTRQHFTSLGGFDPALVSGEDYDICMRSRAGGGPILIVPALRAIHHDYPASAAEFVRRETWHGVGDFQDAKKFLASRVAQVAVLFAALHLLVVLGLIYSRPLAVSAAVLLLLLLVASSCAKFRNLSLGERIHNVCIFYLYFFGRAASAFSAWKRRLTKR